jgi:hypothetical protein
VTEGVRPWMLSSLAAPPARSSAAMAQVSRLLVSFTLQQMEQGYNCSLRDPRAQVVTSAAF